MSSFKKLDCGCEVNDALLVSVCALHGNYTRQRVEKARAPREGVDKELQKHLVVAIAPIVVRDSLNVPGCTHTMVAEKIHDQVHEIMRRMD